MKEAVTWYGKYLDECDDPKLEIALGDMYYRGTGTDRDYGRAMDFYQMAYLDPDAQYRLGNMYRRGHTRNGEPWYFEAYEQYEKAAEQGTRRRSTSSACSTAAGLASGRITSGRSYGSKGRSTTEAGTRESSSKAAGT